MPVSNDNQDYKNPENKKENEKSGQQGKSDSKTEVGTGPEAENNMTSDNLKGKKVDADVEKEEDRPADV